MLIFAPSNHKPSLQTLRYGQRGRAIAVIAVVLVSLACASTSTLTPAQQVQLDALNTLKSIRAIVIAGVNVFNTGYQAGQFNEVQRTQLGTLYNKYLAADAIAATAIQTTTSTDASQIVGNVMILATEVIKFVNTLKAGTP